MGKFDSDDRYIYYYGQESLRRNGVVLIDNKKAQNVVLWATSKTTEWSWFLSKANHSSITVIQVYASIIDAKEAEVDQFYKAQQHLLELRPKKDVIFIIGDWNATVGSWEIPGITGKFGLGVQNAAGQKITEFCQENMLVIANTLFQHHR